MTVPTLRLLSLGAGVQSSVCLLLAAQGRIPRFDAAVFSDTGWEPQAVYRHLDRLTAIAQRAGIPVVRVSNGDIRADALDPAHRFASMPLFSLGPNGERGMARRQCTNEYKIKPIKREVRRRLGYPHPIRVPDGVYAEMAIGISLDLCSRFDSCPLSVSRPRDGAAARAPPLVPLDVVKRISKFSGACTPGRERDQLFVDKSIATADVPDGATTSLVDHPPPGQSRLLSDARFCAVRKPSIVGLLRCARVVPG